MKDCQCKRCGSSTTWTDCWNCGGDGEFDEYDDDPINFSPGEAWAPCNICDGDGGWESCVSGEGWCAEHPLPGRESVPCGEVEWFEVANEA